MVARLRCAGTRGAIDHFAQRRNCRREKRIFVSISRVLFVSDTFSQQIGKVRADVYCRKETTIKLISLYVKVERAVRIDSLETMEALAPLHVLKPEIVRERFTYKSEGLNVAFVRVFRLECEWILPKRERSGTRRN